jgi:hypothetical protein
LKSFTPFKTGHTLKQTEIICCPHAVDIADIIEAFMGDVHAFILPPPNKNIYTSSYDFVMNTSFTLAYLICSSIKTCLNGSLFSPHVKKLSISGGQ